MAPRAPVPEQSPARNRGDDGRDAGEGEQDEVSQAERVEQTDEEDSRPGERGRATARVRSPRRRLPEHLHGPLHRAEPGHLVPTLLHARACFGETRVVRVLADGNRMPMLGKF